MTKKELVEAKKGYSATIYEMCLDIELQLEILEDCRREMKESQKDTTKLISKVKNKHKKMVELYEKYSPVKYKGLRK